MKLENVEAAILAEHASAPASSASKSDSRSARNGTAAAAIDGAHADSYPEQRKQRPGRQRTKPKPTQTDAESKDQAVGALPQNNEQSESAVRDSMTPGDSIRPEDLQAPIHAEHSGDPIVPSVERKRAQKVENKGRKGAEPELKNSGVGTGSAVSQPTDSPPTRWKFYVHTKEKRDARPPNLSADSPFGLYKVDPFGSENPRWVSPPLEVMARARDFGDDNCGKFLRFQNWEGRERNCIIPLSGLLGDGKEPLEKLLDMGFKPQRDKKSIEALKDYIYQTDPETCIRCVSQVGWHAGFFVLPTRSIGPKDSSEQVLFSSELGVSDHKYNSAGTAEDWRNQIGILCSGNSRLIFAVSCAFAAPLLDLVKGENAGFHFRGMSSVGKTTALLAAGSVWGGNSKSGFLETWRSTLNGIEASASLHNHGLLPLDEIGQVSEKEIGEIVYMLGNGGGRSRMNRNITSRGRTQFKLIYLSSGERTLAEIMQTAGKQAKGGQEVRLIEITADAGKGYGIFEELHGHPTGDSLARSLAQATNTSYGTAIVPFLEYVVQNRDKVTEEAKRAIERFLKKHVASDSAGEVFRAGSVMGLVAYAGELATALKITAWADQSADTAVDVLFKAWIEHRGGTGAYDVGAGISAVRQFLLVNGNSRFEEFKEKASQSSERPVERLVVNRAGFKQKEFNCQKCRDTGYFEDAYCACERGFRLKSDQIGEDEIADAGEQYVYYISEDVFKNEICRGFDYVPIVHELRKRDQMRRPKEGSKDRHLPMQKRIPGMAPIRCFIVLPSIFSGE